MKRDMDLVRKILLAVEEHDHGDAPTTLTIEGHSEEQIGYHTLLMGEAGLLKVVETTHKQSASPSAMPLRMTWEGHDFLGAAREPSRWTAALKRISESGAGMTFEILKGVLVALSTEALSGPGGPGCSNLGS